MSDNYRQSDKECLSPGTVMALLDEELDSSDRLAALSHLESCVRCRKLSEDLAATQKGIEVALHCLDDERVAAWVDHRLGRMRGRLGATEIRQTREHLDRCERCRVQVMVLTRACKTRVSVLDWLRGLVTTPSSSRRPFSTPALRWAAVGAVAAAAVVIGYVVAGRGQAPLMPHRETMVAGTETVPASGSQEPPAVAELPDTQPPAPGPGDTREEAGRAGTGGGRVSPSLPPPSQTALVSPDEDAEAEVARALADLARARQSKDAGAETRAAMKLAGLYHRSGDYGAAAEHYRAAAGAAEKAGEAVLQVDSRILLGAALAELGETKQAREELELALGLAREAKYVRGEQNALVQLELLQDEGSEETTDPAGS